jgi:L-2,4-diaminobutyric acid acetyltransferase
MIELRHPTIQDGAALYQLASDSQVLDVNSSYAYLLLCKHFSPTCVVAVDAGVAGFATAYRLPQQPDTLFLWQIAVGASHRGQGLALRMLQWLLQQPSCEGVKRFETTVTPSNRASTALFEAFARSLGAELTVTPYFAADLFPGGGHEAEQLFSIAPVALDKLRSLGA